ncbi:MAG TPA: hypothetical protein VNE59_11555 [Burkholderiales bacterium]|nr:hypothetical protein [Burkholderiales bacterium]
MTGEGALDPLGLSMIGDHLANQILPGLRARMSRPRFVTAIAVSAAVCEGLEERFSADGVTPAYLVFEWLVVEAFVRAGKPEATRHTPGTQKAQDARASQDAMCARNYLKTPTVFGFHGVYKPIARHLGVVDDNLRLSDRGYELLKVWQSEQRLEGFLENTSGGGAGRSARQTLRAAVDEGLAVGHTARSGGWQGWTILAEHLAPANAGPREAAVIERLLADSEAAPRGEIFKLLREGGEIEDSSEDAITRSLLLPKAGSDLAGRLKAIAAYEKVCGILEEAFNWICFLSTHSQARPITAQTFATESRPRELTKELPAAIRNAEGAMSVSPLNAQQLFGELLKGFDGVRDAQLLFEAVLRRHEQVQKDKPPEGKRSWFERSPNGETFVRPPYLAVERPERDRGWNRPYRIATVASFLDDLKNSSHATA